MHCRSIIIDPRKRLEKASDPVSGEGEPLLLPFAGPSAAFIIIISNSYKDAVTSVSFVIDKTMSSVTVLAGGERRNDKSMRHALYATRFIARGDEGGAAVPR